MSRRRILICGSRKYPKQYRVKEFVEALSKDDVVITGLANGPDSVAYGTARELGMIVVGVPFPSGFGKAGGMIRNQVMVDMADEVVAFWDGVSLGTKATIDMARRAGKPTRVSIPGAEPERDSYGATPKRGSEPEDAE